MITRPSNKSLNIQNTDRKYNFEQIKSTSKEDYVSINNGNKEDVRQEMDRLKEESKRIPKRNDENYVYNDSKVDDLGLLRKVIKHGGYVTYKASKLVPEDIIVSLGQSKRNHIEFAFRENYSDEEIRNIQKSFMATTTRINVPVILPDVSPYDIIFSLHEVKTNVDVVRFYFPKLFEIDESQEKYYMHNGERWELKPHYKFQFFKYVQNSLSIWAMEIEFEYDSGEEFEGLDILIEEDLNKRNPQRVTEDDIEEDIEEAMNGDVEDE